MTDEQIIQLAEHMGINMRARPRGIFDNDDGTFSIRGELELHYAGSKILDFAKLILEDRSNVL